MQVPTGKRRRLAAALLAFPLIQFAAGPAYGQTTVRGPLAPLGGQVRMSSGELDPLKGLIRTFEGDLDPFVGRIRTFEGDVDPYKGLIRTFEGDIDPYKGLIRTFWGSLTPTQGELDPLIGRIRTFSDAFIPHSRGTLEIWAQSDRSGDYAPLVARLREMERDGATHWDSEVLRRTGKNFTAGFSDAFFAGWGVDVSNPQSLASLDSFNRQRFLLDWYDNVLTFSNMDRVDHWMNAVNWTPTLTQTQGGGSQALIGLIDFFAANDADVRSKVVFSGGYQNVDNAHGAAVGSLMVASHDGNGIMGIAPRATIAAYNPFDATLTASWTDVKAGINQVGKRGASVINLSLGVPGYTLPAEWRGVFKTSAIDSFKDNTIYVIAAGNDGVAQPRNIEMNGALDSTFLVVGSVDPNGRISAFSNTPGTACLTDGGECKNREVWNEQNDKFAKSDYLKESGLLMNRFLVAPGEMILVSDGSGGVTRMSGTSFAAPLVSGAIALIHDRWPWLKKYPRDVAKIILESAQDLGAPGVDPIYGQGLLDIEAAQSALDFDSLKYYLVNGSSTRELSASTLKRNGIDPIWQTNGMYFSAFEKIDSAERDFLIPLSSRLFNASINGRAFQHYMYDLFTAWMNGSSYTAGSPGFTDSPRNAVASTPDGWSFSMRARHQTVAAAGGGERLALRSTIEMRSPDGGYSFAFGSGDGATLLGGQRQLQMSADFDPYTGGANPLLGFASGDAHLATSIRLANDVDLTLGLTRQDRSIEEELASELADPADRLQLSRLEGYRAQAATVRLDYRVSAALGLSASYTRLDEEGAFFGVRSLEPSDFGESTLSDGLTLAADADLGSGVSLFGSATASMSGSHPDASLEIRGALSSAYQVGLAKQGIFGDHDRLRLSLAQPLTLERGHIELHMVGVIDRETGERGIITQRADISASKERRHRVEALYGTMLLAGRGELNLFASAELRQVRADIPDLTAGGNVRISF